VQVVSQLQPRTSRAVRERRANRLVAIGATSAVVAVVGFILVVAGAISSGVPLIALIVAVVCGLMFRQLIKPR
jgi:hypothetical protein